MTDSPASEGLVPISLVQPRREQPSAPAFVPAPLTSMIGREREVAAVAGILHDPAVRLVTLTGPGGVGKSRLALAIAAEPWERSGLPDGVAFVALAPIGDPDLVALTVAQALGIRQVGHRTAADQLATALRDARMLLVLDNFEHLLPAAPLVADLLAACPGVKILATSRERLRLTGEHAFPVPPLSLDADAVRLFVQRAHEATPAFALTDDEAPVVAAICARLDGLPLAIELAAARVAVLPPRALLARLDRRLPLLTSSPRDAPARHRTMRDAIAWSHDLLTPAEQALFRRLAVFAGGFTLEAAEWVTGDGSRVTDEDDAPSPITHHPTPFVLDLVASLVAKSLVRQVDGPAHPMDGMLRFTLLETVREFAAERLTASGQEAAARDAHAAWTLALTEAAAPHISPMLPTPAAPLWLRRVAAEHDNLRAALAWLEASGRWHDLLRLAAAALHFWELRLHLREGRSWLERALHPDRSGDAPPALRAQAMRGFGLFVLRLGDYPEAEAALAEAHAAWLRLGDTTGAAATLRMLAAVAEYQGDEDRAAARQTEALELYRTAGDSTGIAAALDDLADGAFRRGDLDEAARLATTSVEAARSGGSPIRLVGALVTFGEIASARSDQPSALAALHEGLGLARELSYELGILDALAVLAEVATATGAVEQAARLLGAAALADVRGLSTVPHHALYRRTQAALQAALGEAAFAAARAAGQALPVEQAIAEAFDLKSPAAPPTVRLTPREAQILPLLAAGKSNSEIAAELFVSVRTVEHHVARLAAKLGARGRAAAVDAARSGGLLPHVAHEPTEQ